jgi:Flp pilus assembly protein TadG
LSSLRLTTFAAVSAIDFTQFSQLPFTNSPLQKIANAHLSGGVMGSKHFLDRLRRRLGELRAAKGGNVTMTFALATVPLIAFVGAAVDYSHGNSVKAAMQAASDATGLMLSKEVATLTQEQIQIKANDYFKALFNRPEAENVTVSATYNTGTSQVLVSASAQLKTSFMGLFGYPYLTVGAESLAKWGNVRLRVALVLDTTGSMANAGKIDALKTATKNLLDQLKSAVTTDGDVYVSIIPFSKNVNLGSSNYGASWIDWTDWEAEPATLDTTKGGSKPNNWAKLGPGSSCPFTNSSYGFRCVSAAQGTTNVSTIPSSGYICPGTDSGQKISVKIGIKYNGCYNSVLTTEVTSGSSASCPSDSNTYVSCSCSGSGSGKTCTKTYYAHTWRPANTAAAPAHTTWNGCVTDRGTTSAPSSDYDRKVDAPVIGNPASLFPAEQNAYCVSSAYSQAPVMGLNYDWTAMKSLAESLSPGGATNQPIGLVWGWQSLVGEGPFTVPEKDPNYVYKEAIVLMSDGLNTLDRWWGNGSSTNTSVDKRMYDTDGSGTCANVKAAGITIYALHVNTDGDPMSTLLKNCASSADKFWMVTSANDIITVFNQIGTNLTKLRVAK